MNVPKLG